MDRATYLLSSDDAADHCGFDVQEARTAGVSDGDGKVGSSRVGGAGVAGAVRRRGMAPGRRLVHFFIVLISPWWERYRFSKSMMGMPGVRYLSPEPRCLVECRGLVRSTKNRKRLGPSFCHGLRRRASIRRLSVSLPVCVSPSLPRSLFSSISCLYSWDTPGFLRRQRSLLAQKGEAPQIFYGARTHTQLVQMAKVLKSLPYTPTIATLGSR